MQSRNAFQNIQTIGANAKLIIATETPTMIPARKFVTNGFQLPVGSCENFLGLYHARCA